MAKQNLKGVTRNAVFIMLAAFIASLFLPACEDGLEVIRSNKADTITVIKNLYETSVRTLEVTPNVADTLQTSKAHFKQKSLWLLEDNTIYSFSPFANCKIVINKPSCEYQPNTEMKSKLIKKQIVTQTPYHQDTHYGEDTHTQFIFDNNLIIDCYATIRYQAVIMGNDTFATPHVHLADIDFISETIQKDENKTENKDTYRSTFNFGLSYTTEATTTPTQTKNVTLRPWINKIYTDEATKILKVEYEGSYVGNPYDGYDLNEIITTNKGTNVNTYHVDLKNKITTPSNREQPTTDSLFVNLSSGKKQEEVASTITTATGFTVKTYEGTYTSTAQGKQNGTLVSNTITYTYQVPTKFESEYGSYTIPPYELSFTEKGFSATKESQTDDYIRYKSQNKVDARIAECTPQRLNEIVFLNLAKDKPAVPTDSTYTLLGSGDSYVVDKVITYSDGTTATTTYKYEGYHQMQKQDFGEKITTSLNWNAPHLTRGTKTETTEEKKFSSSTKFVATYTTTELKSTATNNIETGTFVFKETVPIVTFIDGKTTKKFAPRSYTLSDRGASLATTPQTIIKNTITYLSYAYDYTINATFSGTSPQTVISQGTLLVKKEKVAQRHNEKTVVYQDGTVDAITTITYDDGTTETIKASDIFGSRFAFKFMNATAQTKDVSNTNYQVTGSTKNKTTNTQNQSSWQVTQSTYPYEITFENGVSSDKFTTNYAYNNYHFEYQHPTFGTIKFVDPTVRMSPKSLSISQSSNDNSYEIYHATEIVNGNAYGTEGTYTTDLSVTHTLRIPKVPSIPDEPNFGAPIGFFVTATYDPTARVTKRAFVFIYETGIIYAVCDYNELLPKSTDFKHKEDSYKEYNSVGYDKNSADKWQPAKGVDSIDAIRWYKKDGTLMSAIDKALTCKVIGWRNIVGGQYALTIPGYTYKIDGYYITVTAPNGTTVTFNSHY